MTATGDPREGTPYDRAFYDDQVDGSERSARVILPLVFGPLAPRRVVDIGCGQGAWLAAAASLGATELVGLDGPWVDRSRLRHPAIHFVPADLAGGEVPDVGRFDLAISVEVAEHLPAHRADALVAALCRSADAVVFSAAVPYQGGTDHVNERRASTWVARFTAQGFACVDLVRGAVWDDARVEWWYRQNVLIFVRRGSSAHATMGAAPAPRPIDLVHPDAFESKMAYLVPRAGADGARAGRWSRARVRLALAFLAGAAVGAAAVIAVS